MLNKVPAVTIYFLLTQSPANGGLGLGTTVTTASFLVAILGLVAYLTTSKTDEVEPVPAPSTDD